MTFEVAFYVTDRGEFPVLEFLESINNKELAKCLRYIELLRERGNSLPSNFVSHLGEGLWEPRPEYGGVEMRIFYFTVVENVIVLLHAVKKKSQKTAKRDWALASKRKRECEP